jgi:hypothetical protein
LRRISEDIPAIRDSSEPSIAKPELFFSGLRDTGGL